MANKRVPEELRGKRVTIRIRPHYHEAAKALGLNLSEFVEKCLAEKYRKELLENTSVEYYQAAHEAGIELDELTEPEVCMDMLPHLKEFAEYNQP